MSFFKKPKKNIRRRPLGSGEPDEVTDENGDQMDVDDEEQSMALIREKIAKAKKKEQRKQTLLSFEEDFNEADDGEVFQVKKSSQSKKMMKLLDKERKKKKEVKVEKIEIEDDLPRRDKEIVTGDLVVVVKQSEPIRSTAPVLNGRQAELADPDYQSEDEEEEGEGHRLKKPETAQHQFAQPDHMKILLESGRIPDAAMIHAARKRRQKAREMGGDYIPVDDTQKYTNSASKSRLVREDENDGSDDEEETVQMSVPSAVRDRDRKREAFMAVQNEDEDQESDKGEGDEWESQQIRKGVTGAQLAAVQQENMYQQQYSMPTVPNIDTSSAAMELSPSVSSDNVQTLPVIDRKFNVLKAENGCDTPQNISAKLKQRLIDLQEVHRRHCLDRDQVTDDLVATESEVQRLETETPKLAERFRFYQELRGYVTDLVECLDEKMPILVNLEQRVLSLWRKRSEELISRRRQDVLDQANENAPSTVKRNKEEEDARTRRAAEREGRRIRRSKARESKKLAISNLPKHLDGMSSDDEMTELEVTSFRTQKETIESDSRLIFEDVIDEFCTVRLVLRHFEKWRLTDWDSYTEAYVSLCIPKVLSPLLRVEMLMWNPLLDDFNKVEKMRWFENLLIYGLQPNETEESLSNDPDLKLIPLVIEKVVLPKLKDIVDSTWDPLSTSQTQRLVNLLSHLLQEYPSLVSSSKPLNNLLSSIVEKMKSAVENDVFIPIYPRQLMDAKLGQPSNVAPGMPAFFQRQTVSAIKLLRNLLCWQGVVSDLVLQEVALGALLNRYLMVALRTSDPIDATAKCHMISSTFPKWWFQSETKLPQLQMFANQCKQIISQLDVTSPAGRQGLERLSVILRTLGPVITLDK